MFEDWHWPCCVAETSTCYYMPVATVPSMVMIHSRSRWTSAEGPYHPALMATLLTRRQGLLMMLTQYLYRRVNGVACV